MSTALAARAVFVSALALGLVSAPAAGDDGRASCRSISEAVMAACDAEDGLVDDQVTDPRRCEFDPRELACQSGDGPDCLTGAEVDSVLKIYSGPSTSYGEQLFPGLVPGGEDSLWPNAIVHRA